MSDYTRTYEVDLSSYKEVCIRFGINSYDPRRYTFVCPIYNTETFSDYIYTVDANSYTWVAKITVSSTSIILSTMSISTNPDSNYFYVNDIFAR